MTLLTKVANNVRARDLGPIAVIIAAVVIANAAVLLRLVSVDPMILYGTVANSGGSVLPGLPTIDPNSGFVSQAVGHLIAQSWLHGHVPWWNPLQGIGSPIVAEGQNSAFFPLILLFHWESGLFWSHLVLEVVAGSATYFLARRLGVRSVVALGAGVAFALNGTFVWLGGDPGPTLPFLPLALLGVEHVVEAARNGRPGGWRLLAAAFGFSIVAGFPETAFIDALFVALWALVRFFQVESRVRMGLTRKAAAGAAVGLAIAAPFWVAFASYLPHTFVGGHSGAFSRSGLSPAGLSQLLLPYDLGPIFAFHSAHGPDIIGQQWGSVGGYLGVVVTFTALLGVAGARRDPLRLGLAAWVALCLLRTYGFPPVVDIMAPIPGLHQVAFGRYANPSWTLALIMLGALGIDDLVRGRARLARVGVAFGVVSACLGASAAEAWHLMGGALGGAHPHRYVAGSALGGGLFLLGCGAAAVIAVRAHDGSSRQARRRAALGGRMLSGAMAIESILLLGFTHLSAPTQTGPVTGAAAWLAAHTGTNRFTTLGPIEPNYGSYFGAAELNTNDLPVPTAWNDYIATNLDPNAPSISFTGSARQDSSGPSAAQELTTHLASYEETGVRYVVEWAAGADSQGQPFPPPGSPPWPAGPRRVYVDALAAVWELPSPAPLITARPVGSAGASPCDVRVTGWDSALVHCRRPAVLVRRVLDLPGWSASLQGRDRPVTPYGPHDVFQQVHVPAGRFSVAFSYVPPHEGLAVPLALVGLIALCIPAEVIWQRRSPRFAPRSLREHGERTDRSRSSAPPRIVGPVDPVPPASDRRRERPHTRGGRRHR